MESFKEPSYDELSFEQLAKDDPEFHIIYTANNNWLDFQNPQMVKYGRDQFSCGYSQSNN